MKKFDLKLWTLGWLDATKPTSSAMHSQRSADVQLCIIFTSIIKNLKTIKNWKKVWRASVIFYSLLTFVWDNLSVINADLPYILG